MFSLSDIRSWIKNCKHFMENPEILARVDKFAFLISLLPITGVSQIAGIVSKIASDHSLSIKFDQLFDEISKSNIKLASLDVITEEQAHLIEDILRVVTTLEEKFDALIKAIGNKIQEESGISIITEDWSLQKVLNSTFKAKNFYVKTNTHSKTIFEHVSIEANQSVFEASDHSQNTLESVICSGNSEQVQFRGIGQEGKVKVEGASVSMSPKTSLTMGNFYQAVNPDGGVVAKVVF